MNLILNNEPITSKDGIFLGQLLEERNLSVAGIAVGINNKVIKRSDWTDHLLNEGDKITIIKATCGG